MSVLNNFCMKFIFRIYIHAAFSLLLCAVMYLCIGTVSLGTLKGGINNVLLLLLLLLLMVMRTVSVHRAVAVNRAEA